MRDVFISNLNVNELQQKFCSKPYTPETVQVLALSHERGLEDQKLLNSCSMGLALPTLGPTEKKPEAPNFESICAVHNTPDSRGPRQVPSNNRCKPCRNWGGPFKPGHQLSCPAKTVTCRNCQKTGHFAKVCRSAPQQDARHNIQQSNKPPASRPTESKRMRFVRDETRDPEDVFDEDEWQAATPVGKISRSSLEEGEVRSSHATRKSLESESSRENYQILAVRKA